MSAAIRNHTFTSSGGSTTASFTLPACQRGDRLVVIIGGGSRVTGIPGGWKQLDYRTGQEAQGYAMTKIAEAADSGRALSFSMDGGDMRGILAIATVGTAEMTVFDIDRFGTAGQTFAASDRVSTADATPDDALVGFVFSRNSSTLPTSTLGEPANSSLAGGSASAVWLTSAVGYGARSITTGLPGRSGHYFFGVSFWSTDELVTEDYDFQVTQSTGSVSTATQSGGVLTFPSPSSRWYFTLGNLIAPDGSVVTALPAGVDYYRVEADIQNGSGTLRWITSYDYEYGGWFSLSNDQTTGETIAGVTHIRDEVVSPYYGWNSGSGFSIPELFRRARLGHGYGDLRTFSATAPVTVSNLRIILFSKTRVLAQPAIEVVDDGVRRIFARH